MIQNVMAAFGLCHFLGVEKWKMIATAKSFRGLPHRMMELSPIRGVRCINDSKGTNVGASETAVRSVVTTGRLFLLAGGESKGADLTQWAETIKQHCDQVYVYGQDRGRFQSALGDQATLVETLADAFGKALRRASVGDVILFSPACASFDQFDNYQQRGDHFMQLVETHLEV